MSDQSDSQQTGPGRGPDAELRERVRQQQAVADLSEMALNCEELPQLFRVTAALVAETLGSDGTSLFRLDEAAQALELAAAHGLAPEARLPTGPASFSGFTLASGDTVVCLDLAQERRFDGRRLQAQGMRSGLAAVILGRQQPFGVLAAHWRRPHTPSDDEVRFVETVARLLSAAIARGEAEQRILERERETRAVFESVSEALVTFDEGGTIRGANQAASRLFAVDEAALRGQALAPLLAGLGAPPGGAGLLEARRAPPGGRGELELHLAGGTARTLEFDVVPGILPGLHLAAFRDVTADRRMRSRLALADRLSSVGSLAAGIAHELNNPLSYVGANVAFIEKELGRMASPDVRDALQEALDGVERMRTIVRALEAFARPDEQRGRPVQLPRVLEACVSMAWNAIKHRARLVRDLAEVPPVAMGEAHLTQVFLNLLLNAADAVDGSGGAGGAHQIRIRTRRQPDGMVRVSIEDTGRGIPAAIRERIFDPFFTTKPVGEGTGLGLFVCHALLAAEGGSIEVESEEGKGSAFHVLLPAAAPGPEEAPTPPPDVAG